MMVKFLNKFFRRRGSADKKAVIHLSDLPRFLKEKKEQRDKETYRKSKPLIDEALNLVAGLKEITLEIESEDASEMVNERVVKVVATSKPQFVKSMLDLTGSVGKPQGNDVEVFVRNLDVFLADLPKVIIGPGRYLHLAYGEKLEKIRKDSRKLLDAKKALEELIDADSFKGMGEEADSLSKKLSSLGLAESEERLLAVQLEKLSSEKNSLEASYRSLDGSDVFRSFQKRKSRLESVKNNRESAENEIYNVFAQMRKPLRILVKHPGVGGPAVPLKELEEFIEKPVDTYLAKSPGETRKIFESAKAALEKPQDGIKEADRVKALEKTGEIVGEQLLRARTEALRLRDEEQKASEELESSTFLSEKKELEKDIERSGRELHSARTDLERVKKRLDETNIEIVKSKALLEEGLTRLEGRAVVLDVPGL